MSSVAIPIAENFSFSTEPLEMDLVLRLFIPNVITTLIHWQLSSLQQDLYLEDSRPSFGMLAIVIEMTLQPFCSAWDEACLVSMWQLMRVDLMSLVLMVQVQSLHTAALHCSVVAMMFTFQTCRTKTATVSPDLVIHINFHADTLSEQLMRHLTLLAVLHLQMMLVTSAHPKLKYLNLSRTCLERYVWVSEMDNTFF